MFNKFALSLAILSLLLISNLTFGQKILKDVRIYGHSGTIVATNEFLSGANLLSKPIDSYKALSLHLGLRLKNDTIWNSIYKDVSYGFGGQITSFAPHEDLGTPISAYVFMQNTLFDYRRFALRFNGEIGMAFNWKKRDAENSMNDAISLARTVHIDLGIDLGYSVTVHHKVGLGLSVAHFSNAAVKRPNQGINTYTPKVFYAYEFNPSAAPKNLQKPKFNRKTEIDINLVAGYHNYSDRILNDSLSNPYRGINVRVFGINTSVHRQLSHVFSVGLGAGLTWDEGLSLETQIIDSTLVNVNETNSQNIQASLYPTIEFRMAKVSLLLQPGMYVYRQSNNLNIPKFYQRLGLKYHINDWLNVGASLRAYNFKSANFMECTVGVRL